jgi:hypothetical protein
MSSFNNSTINPDDDARPAWLRADDDAPAKPSKSLIARQLATDPQWSADSGKKLGDSQALDLIAGELSGEEWNPDTVDVIAAYVRGTGREILDSTDVIDVWTLTVDARDGNTIVTTVHTSEADAIRCLFDNYDPQGIYGGDMQTLIDDEGLVVHIEPHKVVLP